MPEARTLRITSDASAVPLVVLSKSQSKYPPPTPNTAVPLGGSPMSSDTTSVPSSVRVQVWVASQLGVIWVIVTCSASAVSVKASIGSSTVVEPPAGTDTENERKPSACFNGTVTS